MKREKYPFIFCCSFPGNVSKGVVFALTHLLTQCKSQYITGIKLGRTATVFSQDRVP